MRVQVRHRGRVRRLGHAPASAAPGRAPRLAVRLALLGPRPPRRVRRLEPHVREEGLPARRRALHEGERRVGRHGRRPSPPPPRPLRVVPLQRGPARPVAPVQPLHRAVVGPPAVAAQARVKPVLPRRAPQPRIRRLHLVLRPEVPLTHVQRRVPVPVAQHLRHRRLLRPQEPVRRVGLIAIAIIAIAILIGGPHPGLGNPSAHRRAPRQQREPRRAAHGRRRVHPLQHRPARRQRVQVRRADPRAPHEPDLRMTHVVRQQHQNVRPSPPHTLALRRRDARAHHHHHHHQPPQHQPPHPPLTSPAAASSDATQGPSRRFAFLVSITNQSGVVLAREHVWQVGGEARERGGAGLLSRAFSLLPWVSSFTRLVLWWVWIRVRVP